MVLFLSNDLSLPIYLTVGNTCMVGYIMYNIL